MANANVINEKAAVVAALVERLKGAEAGVIVDYSGLTVAEDTEMRAALRKEGVEYAVVKNTMMRRALDSVGLEALDSVLNGTSSLATGTDDPIVPIRLVSEYSKKLGDKATEIYNELSGQFMCDYDEAGSIGKRYRRQDEIGTPYCITLDFETVGDENTPADHCVTIRDRDTMEQVKSWLEEKLAY
mgnify:CR=1 FL=1